MDTELDATQQDYVRTAQDSGKALVSLINEVLDQAKIESGKIELEAMQFDLRAIMDEVLALFSGKAHEKGVEVIHVSRNLLFGFLWAPLLVFDPSLHVSFS
jgi:histidine kinase 2/3/4 (cytokinin receptor)